MKTRGHYTTKAVDFIFRMGEAVVMYLKVLGFVALLVAGVAHADAETEARVREYFADAPVMVEIARCESKFRQTTDAGNPFYGGAGGRMLGVFQLYTDVHQSYALSVLGYDITTLEGNLGYAQYLYQTEGTDPWISSFPCWGGDAGEEGASPAAVEDTGGLTMNLSLGMEHPQILLLQQKLNAAGYAVAAEGPGAPGQETERFGALTRAAVRAFQCAEMQICGGDEYSTGYGLVGAKTRAALVAARGAPAAVSSPPPGASTPAQEAEIERLRAQIAELTAILAGLLAARGS